MLTRYWNTAIDCTGEFGYYKTCFETLHLVLSMLRKHLYIFIAFEKFQAFKPHKNLIKNIIEYCLMIVFFLFKWFVGLLQVEHHLSLTLVISALRDIHVNYLHDVHRLNSCSVEGWRSGHVVLELRVRSYSRSQCPCSPSCNQLIDYYLKSFYLTFIPKKL